MEIRSGRPEDKGALEAFLGERHAELVARRGELVDSLAHPAVLARSDQELVGAATYVVVGTDCELLTLHAGRRLVGTGSALLGEVRRLARASGCTRLWVVTTNDNVEALRFYQRRGFRLAVLRPGAVDESRALLKPEIPTSGAFGIALRDELELELDLSEPAGPRTRWRSDADAEPGPQVR